MSTPTSSNGTAPFLGMDTLKSCATYAFVGKRRSGKTVWARKMCAVLPPSLYLVITGSAECRTEWQSVLTTTLIVDKTAAAVVIERLIRHQEQLANQNGHVPSDSNVALILDDCGSDKSFMNARFIFDLFANGRHYGITLMVTLQSFTQLHLQNRSNLDYICFVACPNQLDMKRIHTEYGGDMVKKDMHRIVLGCISPISSSDYREMFPLDSDTTPRRGMCIIDNTNGDAARIYRFLHSKAECDNPKYLLDLPSNVVLRDTIPSDSSDPHIILLRVNGKTKTMCRITPSRETV